MGSKLISDLQGLVEAILSPGHAERAAVAKRKEAGVVQFTGESRDDVSAVAVAVERSGARRPRRREIVIVPDLKISRTFQCPENPSPLPLRFFSPFMDRPSLMSG